MTTLIAVTLFAAFVSGGLGYGFSSITVPVGLLYYANRVLNPALVLVEILVNGAVVFLNRGSLGPMLRKVAYMLLGLVPAIILGSHLLKTVNPVWIKIGTYVMLVPFVLIQSMGFRKPLDIHKPRGMAFGGFVGVIYSMTTLSGPPLAVLLQNESLDRRDFKAAIGIIRLGESILTALAYGFLGLFNPVNLDLFLKILPGILIGIPLGSIVISKLNPLYFRRICISFDAWLIGFGLYRVTGGEGLLPAPFPAFIFAAVVLADSILVLRWFLTMRRDGKPQATAFERFEGVWGLWLPALPPKGGKESHVHP